MKSQVNVLANPASISIASTALCSSVGRVTWPNAGPRYSGQPEPRKIIGLKTSYSAALWGSVK